MENSKDSYRHSLGSFTPTVQRIGSKKDGINVIDGMVGNLLIQIGNGKFGIQ
jgi:hypothetical protein